MTSVQVKYKIIQTDYCLLQKFQMTVKLYWSNRPSILNEIPYHRGCLKGPQNTNVNLFKKHENQIICNIVTMVLSCLYVVMVNLKVN